MNPMPAGEKRECCCPIANHKHGTVAAYAGDGCRCLDCRAAAAAEYRRRYRLKAYNRFESRFTNPIGTCRRVHALMTLGYSIKAQALMIGVAPKQLTDGVNGAKRTILIATASKVAALYDELWDKPAAGGSKEQNVSIAMTRNRAARYGYASPLCWNDDELDNPDARPYTGRRRPSGVDDIAVEEAMTGRRVALTLTERHEAVRRLTEAGYSAKEIADRLRITPRSVIRVRASSTEAAA